MKLLQNVEIAILLSCSNKQFPLFNGATEINYKDYDIFLKNLKYKFS